VLVTLKTVQVALEAMLRRKPPPSDWPGSRETFFQGETRLRENTRAVLGGSAPGGIDLVTLAAETAGDPAYMLETARRGTDVVRINYAHLGHDDWDAMIANPAQQHRRTVPAR
jgi:hypothetical protein